MIQKKNIFPMAKVYPPTLWGALKMMIRTKRNCREIIKEISWNPKLRVGLKTRKKKILIYQDFGDEVNGITRNWSQLCEEKFENTIEILWVTVCNSFQNRFEQDFQKCYLPQDYSFSMPHGSNFQAGFPIKKYFINLVNDFKPDLVQFVTPGIASFSLEQVFIKRGIPTIWEYRTDLIAHLGLHKISWIEKLVVKNFTKRFLNQAKLVLFPTDYFLKKTMEDFNLSGENFVKVNRGINNQHFNFPNSKRFKNKLELLELGKLRFFFAGRLGPEKHILELIDIWKDFVKENKNAELFIAGDGPLKSYLVNQEKIHINLLGNLSELDIGEHLRKSHFLLFPSTTETFGQIILESLCCGTPVLISSVGGGAEILGDSNGGIKVEGLKQELWGETLMKIKGISHEKYVEMVKSATKIADGFSIQESRKSYLEFWEAFW